MTAALGDAGEMVTIDGPAIGKLAEMGLLAGQDQRRPGTVKERLINAFGCAEMAA